MTLATDLQAAALELLSDLGQQLTFTRYTSLDYNVATGGVDPVTSTTYTGYAHPSKYSSSEIDGETVRQDDVLLLLYSITTPLIQDTTSINSNTYKVLSVDYIKAQGSNIIYKLQLRK